MDRVKRNSHFLRYLGSIQSSGQRRSLLESASVDQITSLAEIAYNILSGVFELNDTEIDSLRRYKNVLRKLASKEFRPAEKRVVLIANSIAVKLYSLCSSNIAKGSKIDSEGIRQLIVIPQTQYRQLIQNQKQAQTASPPKEDNCADEDNAKSSENHLQKDSFSTTSRNETDIVYSSQYDVVNEVEGNILQIIQCSYPKTTMKKTRKLFLFIINFGSEVLTFNRTGSVLINGDIVDPKSNILDLLEAAVTTDQYSEKPVGYRSFLQPLQEINVPSNFYVAGEKTGKWCNENHIKTICVWINFSLSEIYYY